MVSMKRWSLPYNSVKQGPFGVYDAINHDVKLIRDNMIHAINEWKRHQDDPSSNVLPYFDPDGWLDEDPEYGFYVPEVHIADTYEKLEQLTNEGYDVRIQWRDFRMLISDIWKALPEFYAGHPKDIPLEYQIKQPENYDPEKPFPDLEIPADID